MDLVGNPKADRFSRGGTGFEDYTVNVLNMFFFKLGYLEDLVSSNFLILNGLFYQSFYGEHAFKVCSPFK